VKKLAGRLIADVDSAFCRLYFKLPQNEARRRARREFISFPADAYLTEIDSWQEFPDGLVEFTVKRLRGPSERCEEACSNLFP
jgi:hypothetical protein